MAYSLSNLKKSSSLEKLNKQLEDVGSKKFKKDERYWELTVDKAGNGFATIRFLDAPHVDGEDGLPFQQIFTHGFQGPGGWYIENSLTTLGENDPVSEYNSKLWATGIESNKTIARQQKRKLSYVSNILVVKDSAKPECEGKVFLFKYGKKIFDKIQEKAGQSAGGVVEDSAFVDPDEAAKPKFNAYNFWEGANFKLKARKVEGQRNYDKSEFADQSPVGTDAEIEKVWKSSYSLVAEVQADKFKPYAELKARLDKVLGLDGASASPQSNAESSAAAEVDEAVGTPFKDDDSDLDHFRKLANE
jgi:hypothetical protein